MGTRTLIVGGTGILRPAVHVLAQRGCSVTVVGRQWDRLNALSREVEESGASGAVIGLRADYTEPETFCQAIRRDTERNGLYTSALLYCADAPKAALKLFGNVVERLIVMLLPSKFAAPDRPLGRDGYPDIPGKPDMCVLYLLLGWHVEQETTRWHTPREISLAALDVLASERDAVLGTVRPWTMRPT